MRERAKAVAQLMGLLANENRLLILCALLERPMTVWELAREVPHITPSALSQHLQKLKSAGLVDGEKQGQYVQYSIQDQRLYAVMAALKEQYC